MEVIDVSGLVCVLLVMLFLVMVAVCALVAVCTLVLLRVVIWPKRLEQVPQTAECGVDREILRQWDSLLGYNGVKGDDLDE